MRRIHIFLASGLLLLGCTACGGGTVRFEVGGASVPSGSSQPGSNTATNTADGANSSSGVAFVGRTVTVDPADATHVRFSWAGVAVGVHFMGTGLVASMNDLPATFLGHTGHSYYDVMVDGQPGSTFHVTSDTQNSYPVAQNLPAGEHTVWFTKRTEGMIGSTELHSIQLDPGGKLLAPPPHRPHRIEVFGASADVGYGVEAINCGGYQDAQENQNKAWPQLAANQLDADLHQLSASGKGLVFNYDPSSDPTLTMPVLYPRVDINQAGPLWDFSKWTAEVVALDIGGNDYTGAKGPPDPAVFIPAYIKFLQTILQHYPKATVYVLLNATQTGNERDTLRTDMQQVVQQAQAMGMTGVRFLEFTAYTGNTFACDNHPTAALHAQMAQEFVAKVRADLGWR